MSCPPSLSGKLLRVMEMIRLTRPFIGNMSSRLASVWLDHQQGHDNFYFFHSIGSGKLTQDVSKVVVKWIHFECGEYPLTMDPLRQK